MKDMFSKEHYCCKINKLFINEKQCFPSSFMICQNSQLPFKQRVADGGSGEGGGGCSHCKWCANDITAYSKNNVTFFYKQKILIPPFVQPFDILLFIDCFTSIPLQPILGKSFPFS